MVDWFRLLSGRGAKRDPSLHPETDDERRARYNQKRREKRAKAKRLKEEAAKQQADSESPPSEK